MNQIVDEPNTNQPEDTASVMSQIIDGWKNYIFPTPETEEMAKQRLTKCMICEWRSKISNRCKLCGCPVEKAVRSRPKKCPDGRW